MVCLLGLAGWRKARRGNWGKWASRARLPLLIPFALFV